MKHNLENRKLWGVGLLGLGLLALFSNMGFLGFGFSGEEAFAVLLFAGLGAAFASIFLRSSKQWWAVIPAGVFFTLAAVISLELIRFSAMQGPTFLAGIGATFAAVFLLTQSRQWWAAIPSGLMFTLSIVAASDVVRFINLGNGGAIFFLGIALTFAFLYYIPTAGGRKRWAMYPALATGALGAFIWFTSLNSLPFGWFWAVAMIAGGVYLLRKEQAVNQMDTRENTEPVEADIQSNDTKIVEDLQIIKE